MDFGGKGLGHFSPAAHELASKTFKRTPNGLIFTEDLKRVFSILLICLELKEKPSIPQKNPLIPSFQKTYPFSFSLQDAISKMADLILQVNMNTTKVSVSYSIQPELACRMLRTFMDAKLLHVPADRTRAELKDGVSIQPTPKGVAVLQRYTRQTGLKDVPPILKSDLNSMELFTFERSSMTDAIIHSDYFVSLLFVKLMGPTKNIWSPDNGPDKVPTLAKLLECADDTFSFESINVAWSGYSQTEARPHQSGSHIDPDSIPNIQDQYRISPLSHRFFTNPDSTSHTQYYTSSSGVRLFNTKTFGNERVLYECTFSTKAIWQWLMDCTDIVYPKEAVTVASLFLKNGLIKPITLAPSDNHKHRFSIGPNCFFTLTQLGWESVQWKSENSIRAFLAGVDSRKLTSPQDYNETKPEVSRSSSDLASGHKPAYFTDLTHVLRDPGMRYLFRTHLEREFCVENLDVYIEIKKFLKRMTVLKNLLDTKSSKESDNNNVSKSKHFSDLVVNTINHALFRQSNECLETAYQIYSSFIAQGSPYQLNIDHTLRESITEVILYPQPCMFISCSEEATVTENFTKRVDGKAGMTIQSEINYPNRLVRDNEIQSIKHGDTRKDVLREHCGAGESANEIIGDNFSGILKTLKLIYPLFEKVANSMYRLMSVDSLPKFINSDLYQEAAVMLNFEGKIS
ncbi:LANO_0H24652g1_1 [Lachancea nothofagi CBS 11611]|uniref:LANO_0H24652g1_1 n=1 Tax=Lachancea nothofagi CBS 11611 TaxID=1266666 RepID=A0A1G4KNT2_9SACH|nr:LANO_0H24652g1_1 [Lachancea nothofagi CBS 11611]